MKTAVRKLALVVAAVLLVNGCATGSRFVSLPVPDSSTGSLVIYRLKQFTNGGGYPCVYIDGTKRGRLLNGTYVQLALPPGPHEVKLANFWNWDMKGQSWPVTVEAGRQYIYRVTTNTDPLEGSSEVAGGTSVQAAGTGVGLIIAVSKTVRVEEVRREQALTELFPLKLGSCH